MRTVSQTFCCCIATVRKLIDSVVEKAAAQERRNNIDTLDTLVNHVAAHEVGRALSPHLHELVRLEHCSVFDCVRQCTSIHRRRGTCDVQIGHAIYSLDSIKETKPMSIAFTPSSCGSISEYAQLRNIHSVSIDWRIPFRFVPTAHLFTNRRRLKPFSRFVCLSLQRCFCSFDCFCRMWLPLEPRHRPAGLLGHIIISALLPSCLPGAACGADGPALPAAPAAAWRHR